MKGPRGNGSARGYNKRDVALRGLPERATSRKNGIYLKEPLPCHSHFALELQVWARSVSAWCKSCAVKRPFWKRARGDLW